MISTHEACERSGITFRRLDYWIRMGLIDKILAHRGWRAMNLHAGSGSRRWLPEQIVPILRLLGRVGNQISPDGTGVPTEALVKIANRYEYGCIQYDGFILAWEVECEQHQPRRDDRRSGRDRRLHRPDHRTVR